MSVAFVCLALVGLDAARTWQARLAIIANAEDETANLARSLAQHAHETIQVADAILISLRERIETDGLAAAQLDQLQRIIRDRVAMLPALAGVFLFDAHGDWIASSIPAPAEQSNNAGRAYFAYHREHTNLGTHVGSPIRSRSSGKWVITISRRLNTPDGQFAGVVVATVSIDYMNAFYATFDVHRSDSISLMTIGGLIAARSPLTPTTIGADVSRNLIFSQLLPKAPSGSFRYIAAVDGIDRLGSYLRVEAFPLIVVVARGFDALLSAWRRDAITHLAISLGLACSLALLGTQLARQLRKRQKAERLYRMLEENSNDAIMCIGLDGRRLYISPAFSTLTGWSLAETVGKEWHELIHPDDRVELEAVARRTHAGEPTALVVFRYLCKSGAEVWVESRIRRVPAVDKEQAQLVVNVRDISDRKSDEARLAAANLELANQARTDALTGIANRRCFDEAIQQEWARGIREEHSLSLLMIDVDRFKRYNDRYGHPQGDLCLRAVADALTPLVRRPGDLIARYGGEEFAVLLPDTSLSGAVEVAESIRAAVEALALPHGANQPMPVVTISIGAATALPRQSSATEAHAPSDLLGSADAALYQAKRTGRNRVATSADIPVTPAPPVLATEQQRLDTLAIYESAGATEASESLSRLARLTAALFNAPIAMVTLIGHDRQCVAGLAGLPAGDAPRELSFCAHAIAGDEVFVVTDTHKDMRFQDNPFVTGEAGIRFYAGAPLVGPEGATFGTLCIADRVARQPLMSSEKALLTDLAALASSYLDQRLSDRQTGR
jgi:diguanylate cyclase (GGDEF)-like protein/PAS domain S-box-containing protein